MTSNVQIDANGCSVKCEYAPIGSRVTESECKVLAKQRMCKGSAKWRDQGASVALTLRSLQTTAKRWAQFWGKYSQYGFQPEN